MKVLHLVGRVIVAVYLLFNGLNHFIRLDMLTGYAASKGVPVPTLAVIIAGLLLLLAGLSIGFGYKPKIGILALALFFIPVTLMMHNFWAVSDPAAKSLEFVNFSKNFGLLGFSLMLLAIPEPWPFGLGKGS